MIPCDLIWWGISQTGTKGYNNSTECRHAKLEEIASQTKKSTLLLFLLFFNFSLHAAKNVAFVTVTRIDKHETNCPKQNTKDLTNNAKV